MYSPNIYAATGGQTLHDVTFPYRTRASVRVRVEGVEVPYTWVNATRVQTAPLTGGDLVEVIRVTEIDEPEVDFENTSVILKTDMNSGLRQNLDRHQEVEKITDRALLMPPTMAGFEMEPSPNNVLVWDSEGDAVVSLDPTDLVTVAGYADARVELFTGDGVADEFEIAFHPGVLANLDISVDGVTMVAGVDFTWSHQVVTFTVPPILDAQIQVRYARPLAPMPDFDIVVASVDTVTDAMEITTEARDETVAARDVTITKAAEAATSAADAASVTLPGGKFGHLFTRVGDEDGNGAFVSRDDLSRQPSLSSDLAVAANYQVFTGFTTNPHLRLTVTPTAGEIELEFLQATVSIASVGVAVQTLYGRTMSAKLRGVTAASFANLGLGLTFSPDPPVLGGSVAVMPAGAIFVGLRGNGGITATTRDGSATDAVTLTGNSISAWTIDQEIEVTFTPTVEDCSEGWFAVYAGPTLLQVFHAAGLPANAYIQAGVRGGAGVGDTAVISQIKTYSRPVDLPLRLWLDEDAAPGGDGSKDAPFNNVQDLQDAYRFDGFRRELEVTGAGHFKDVGLEFQALDWSRITIQAAQGRLFRLDGSISVPIGDPGWTQIGTTGHWYRPGYARGVAGLGAPSVGLLEVTPGITQAFGRTGLVTLQDRYLYGRAAAQLTSLSQGTYSGHSTGDYAGNVVVRAVDGGDPSTKAWELSSRQRVISVSGADPSGNSACHLTVRGVDIRYAWSQGLYAQRCTVDIRNSAIRSTIAGYGLELPDCDGEIRHCLIEGTYFDGGHSNDSTAQAGARRPILLFADTDFMGAYHNTTLGVHSDTASPHIGNDHVYVRCRFWSAGKDGVSLGEGGKVIDCDIRDPLHNGISSAPYEGTMTTLLIQGGLIDGPGNNGIVINGSTVTAANVRADVIGTRIKDAGRASVEINAENDLNLVVNTYGVTTITTGAAPSQGHVVANAGPASAVNVYSEAPLG